MWSFWTVQYRNINSQLQLFHLSRCPSTQQYNTPILHTKDTCRRCQYLPFRFPKTLTLILSRFQLLRKQYISRTLAKTSRLAPKHLGLQLLIKPKLKLPTYVLYYSQELPLPANLHNLPFFLSVTYKPFKIFYLKNHYYCTES